MIVSSSLIFIAFECGVELSYDWLSPFQVITLAVLAVRAH